MNHPNCPGCGAPPSAHGQCPYCGRPHLPYFIDGGKLSPVFMDYDGRLKPISQYRPGPDPRLTASPGTGHR